MSVVYYNGIKVFLSFFKVCVEWIVFRDFKGEMKFLFGLDNLFL